MYFLSAPCVGLTLVALYWRELIFLKPSEHVECPEEGMKKHGRILEIGGVGVDLCHWASRASIWPLLCGGWVLPEVRVGRTWSSWTWKELIGGGVAGGKSKQGKGPAGKASREYYCRGLGTCRWRMVWKISGLNGNRKRNVVGLSFVLSNSLFPPFRTLSWHSLWDNKSKHLASMVMLDILISCVSIIK